MPFREPTNYGWMTYVWVIFVACAGGVAGYVKKVRSGEERRFRFRDLFFDVIVSAFVGVVTFWLCQASGLSQLWTAALVGMSGQMGARAIMFVEGSVTKRLQKILSGS